MKQEYPKWLYNEKGSCIVKDEKAHKALGKGWFDSPADIGEAAKKAHELDKALKAAKDVEAKEKEATKTVKDLEKEAKAARALADKEAKEADKADSVADEAEEALEEAKAEKPLFE